MPTDYDKEFGRYVERFERLVGSIDIGQYGRYKGRLVRRLSEGQFRDKVEEYMGLGRRFTEMVSSRGTIEGDEDILGDGIAFAGVSRYPARVKCALLGWLAFKAALAEAGAGTARDVEEK